MMPGRPGPRCIPRAEDALLGPDRLLVAADPCNQGAKFEFLQNILESGCLARRRAGGRGQCVIRIGQGGAIAHDEIQLPFLRIPVAEGIHLRKLLAGIDMNCGKGHPPAKGLTSQMEHDIGVFPQ